MKKALILGTLAGQVDAILTLQARDVEVHACGHRRQGPGVEVADEFHLVDITDPEAVQALAQRIGVDLVYSVGSDIAMPTVAQVSDRLGLPHFHSPEVTELLRNKEMMRARLDEAGVSPVAYLFVEPTDPVPPWTVFPAIVKPVDSQGQRGISIVESPEDLPAALRLAKSEAISGNAILEELLVGPEVSAHVIVEDGEVRLILPSDRHVWAGPMVGIPHAHSIPLNSGTIESSDELVLLVEQCVSAIGVVNGPLYFQTIVTSNGPRIVEIASRLDGCHLWRMIKTSTGFDLLDAVLARLLGEPWPDFSAVDTPRPTTLEFFLENPNESVTEQYMESAPHADAEFVEFQLEAGQMPRRTNPTVARLGYQIYSGF
ncbi:ATP-grasp domain-containing protein [Demequina aurantiaca]|uniref:ATP-grasp domain-containing protein n=1 Tax=Demequina aurantiaca TaxID=676200 RepID=UPI0007810CE2|nr:ATP-grasp domain-containing protein [Demequina aurantiaca]